MTTCNPVMELREALEQDAHEHHQQAARQVTQQVTTFALDLQGEPGAVLRLLRATLKLLGRTHGVRCAGIRPIPPATAPAISTKFVEKE